MSDIKQAAKWLLEGKKVRRAMWEKKAYLRLTPAGFFNDNHGVPACWLMAEDWLAEDWEIFEWLN
jgi:hypothetical protein